jgi:hypothetical protein
MGLAAGCGDADRFGRRGMVVGTQNKKPRLKNRSPDMKNH